MFSIPDPRQQRGLEIAATANIVKKGGAWIVPSQSGKGRYTVCLDPQDPHCSCPDHETRGVKCKHIFAAEYVISRERNRDGSVTVTERMTVQKTVQRAESGARRTPIPAQGGQHSGDCGQQVMAA